MCGPMIFRSAISLRQAKSTGMSPPISRHASDAVGDKERQDNLAAAGKPVAESGMHVHVPQSRNKKLAAPVDDVRILSQRHGGSAGDESDAIAVDHNHGVGAAPNRNRD